MEYIVTSPDGQKFRVNAPEGATREQALAYAKSQFAKMSNKSPVTKELLEARKQSNPAEYIPSSPEYQARYGANSVAARPKPVGDVGSVIRDPLLTIGSSALGGIAGGLSGLGAHAGNLFGMNLDPSAAVEAASQKLTYEPRTQAGEATTNLISWPFRKLGEFAHSTGDVTAEASGSPALGAAVNTGIQALPALLLRGRGTSPAGRTVEGGAGVKTSKTAVPGRASRLEGVPPTIEELGTQVKAAYQRASDAGVVITENSLTKLKASIVNNKEIKGRINEKLHPQSSEAIRQITETKGQISLDQLENLRRIANDAKGAGKADGRLAAIVVDEIDNYMGNIGRKDIVAGDASGFAALSEARSLYSRKAKAEEIHRLIERAEIGRSKFSQSGLENALRNEFRTLAKNDKKMRRFTAEERAAIRMVAEGGPMANAARFIGKFLPTGVVSSLPTILASSTLGMGGGVAVPAIGAAGRFAATKLTRGNALRAEELMRRGPERRPRNALLNPLLRETVE